MSLSHTLLSGTFFLMAGIGCSGASPTTDSPLPVPEEDDASTGLQKAVLAGGCFWGVDAVYKHVRGVMEVRSGYAGGAAETAHYDIVCTGRTGHAESVEVTYDAGVVSFGTLLRIFFSVAHDPTEVDRQGPDIGSQYRSVIFTLSQEQGGVSKAYIDQLDRSGLFKRPIATEILPLDVFYPAEDYHQNFLEEHPNYPYIVYHDLPKLAALKRLYPELWKP